MRITRTETIAHPFGSVTVTHTMTLAYAIGQALQSAVATTGTFLRRLWRVLHAIIAVSRKHAPKWLAVVLAIALAIPGPVDELVVLAIIGVMVAVKPIMRADMVAGIRAAWSQR